ncbi:hypothetical protein O181_113691 [Austropuccinia psidii MF-1]|uniref:Uncharacterized protein n=1 Tax=Austropuccinia psidii MF-1 TaxID=1389203 RepID=A0A9Q3K4U1_9BASI|nr:hypothetical protein [Austropuccinia psidii MF-1]
MSSFTLYIYIDENSHEVIAIVHNEYCYTIHCICNIDPNADVPNISPPTSVTPFSGSILAWPQSNNPLPMTNGHHSPPELAGNVIPKPVAGSKNDPTSDSISISAMTNSNPSSKLCQLFDVFNWYFCDFYNYIQKHPDNVDDYGSLSGLRASL